MRRLISTLMLLSSGWLPLSAAACPFTDGGGVHHGTGGTERAGHVGRAAAGHHGSSADHRDAEAPPADGNRHDTHHGTAGCEMATACGALALPSPDVATSTPATDRTTSPAILFTLHDSCSRPADPPPPRLS